MIENFTKGALVDVPDERDFKAEPLLAASPSVDWEKGFILEKPPLWDQQSADCCVSAAWSYYHRQLTGKSYSKRALFSRIAQAYGAYIRDGGVALVKIGQETSEEVLDPETRTPQSMRDKTGISDREAADDRELNSFIIYGGIDAVAKAIRDYKGVVFGVKGSNEGWQNLSDPRPPKQGEETWGHALYLYGYCIRNGKKCLIARSSWNEQDHYINEDYFGNDNTFNPWTLIPRKEQTMDKKYIININGTLGVIVVGQFAVSGGLAKDPKALEDLKYAFSVPTDAPIVEFPNV